MSTEANASQEANMSKRGRYVKRDLQKRPITVKRDLQKRPITLRDWHPHPCCNMSKEANGAQEVRASKKSKYVETSVGQNRPTKEIYYGVATNSRLLQILGFLCRIQSLL